MTLVSTSSEVRNTSARADKEARSGTRNPTWPRGARFQVSFGRNKQRRRARGVVRDDLVVEAADRNTRPILTTTTADNPRSTDHHLRRWPSYFRRARQCRETGSYADLCSPVDNSTLPPIFNFLRRNFINFNFYYFP